MRITLDNTSPLLQYVSIDPAKPWIQDSGDSEDNAINKYFRQTMTKTEGQGNYMALEFNGTEIYVYGAKRGNHGNYSVSLDGSEPVAQSGRIADPGTYQTVLYQATKLDGNTPHYIQVSNLPGDKRNSYFDIDYVVIKVDMDKKKIFTTRLDDTSPNCQYSGDGWGVEPPMSPEMYYNTTAHISHASEDKVTCGFNGTSIEVVGGLFNDHGNYTVSIDGGPAITLNGSYPTFQAQATLFLATNLVDGPHTITMTNTESRFDLDYMVVNSTTDPTAEVNLSGTTIIDPIDPGQEPSPNNAVKPDVTDDSSNAGMIGGIIGSVAGLALFGLLVILLFRRCRQRSRTPNDDFQEKYYRPHAPSQSSSIRPFQVDLSAAEISPFTGGMYTYQDSPGDHKRSPLITGPPQSAFAFHPYQSGTPRSAASSVSTTNLILGLSPVPAPRFSRRQRHDRQASISDIVNGMPETAVTRAWTRTDEGNIGSAYNQPRSGGTTGSSSGSGTAGTNTSGWSPRPKGAQFSLPPLALPPKMFVLGQDGEVEPLNSPGGSGRSSVMTKVGP